MRLLRERVLGYCIKCTIQINAAAINRIGENLKDPKKMKQVKKKCKAKGLSQEQIEKGIEEAKKISTK